jgi:hypothetical protein
MILGQIELGTPFGNILYDLCKSKPEIKTVVEIGTWHGMGSTKCLLQGLIDSGKTDANFISLEANRKMYDVAVGCWKDTLPSWAKLIHGRVVEVSDMDNSNLGYQHPDEPIWFNEDKNAMLSCANVIDQLPSKIDLLFLDGGEYSTHAEFLKLKDRSSMILLDDTTARKCKTIRETVLSDTENYTLLFDETRYRGGVMGFLNKNRV